MKNSSMGPSGINDPSHHEQLFFYKERECVKTRMCKKCHQCQRLLIVYKTKLNAFVVFVCLIHFSNTCFKKKSVSKYHM